MPWLPRVALMGDVPQIGMLIPASSFALQRRDYSRDQIEAALGPVFGVDAQLIEDGTYFVVEDEAKVIGCGGWSFRRSLYGGDADRRQPDPPLDPATDPARIRAFFTDPAYARQGVGSAILTACEAAIAAAGFRHVEVSATLAGQRLYSKHGYASAEHYEIPLDAADAMTVVRMTKTMPGARETGSGNKD